MQGIKRAKLNKIFFILFIRKYNNLIFGSYFLDVKSQSRDLCIITSAKNIPVLNLLISLGFINIKSRPVKIIDTFLFESKSFGR